jgi:hypothetical protein
MTPELTEDQIAEAMARAEKVASSPHLVPCHGPSIRANDPHDIG